jgi:hypothetical protein
MAGIAPLFSANARRSPFLQEKRKLSSKFAWGSKVNFSNLALGSLTSAVGFDLEIPTMMPEWNGQPLGFYFRQNVT